MVASSSPEHQPRKYAYIDALRGIAVLLVLFDHTGSYGSQKYTTPVRMLIELGAHGVQLFFILSALTLFLSASSRNYEQKQSWVDFYLRRFFRIAPMFYVAMAYYIGQNFFGPNSFLRDANQYTAAKVLSTLTFTNSFNPYWINSYVPGGWSVAIEMLFYAILPLLFMRIRTLATAIWYAFAAYLLLVVGFLLQTVHPLITVREVRMEYEYYYFLSQLPVFLLGICLYFLIQGKVNKKDCAPFIALTGILCLAQAARPGIIPVHLIYSMGFVLLIYSQYLQPVRVIVNSFTVLVGKVSYSMYLSHFAILFWLQQYGLAEPFPSSTLSFILRFLVLVTLALPLSLLLHTLVEQPGIQLGKTLISRLHSKQQPVQLGLLNG